MKTQLMEAESVVDLVPQILHLKKILVPIDFSDPSKKAIQYASRLAEQFDSEIVLLHVMELPPPIAAMRLAYDARRSSVDRLSAAKKKLRLRRMRPPIAPLARWLDECAAKAPIRRCRHDTHAFASSAAISRSATALRSKTSVRSMRVRRRVRSRQLSESRSPTATAMGTSCGWAW